MDSGKWNRDRTRVLGYTTTPANNVVRNNLVIPTIHWLFITATSS